MLVPFHCPRGPAYTSYVVFRDVTQGRIGITDPVLNSCTGARSGLESRYHGLAESLALAAWLSRTCSAHNVIATSSLLPGVTVSLLLPGLTAARLARSAVGLIASSYTCDKWCLWQNTPQNLHKQWFKYQEKWFKVKSAHILFTSRIAK